MALRFRILGMLIIACGVSLCYGAVELWPSATPGSATREVALGVLRVLGATVAALVGVLNVGAGLAVLVLKPARE